MNFVCEITAAEAAELYQQLPESSKLLFALSIETGCRISDLLRLKIRNIKNPMHIYISRPGVIRSFSLSHELFAALSARARYGLPNRYIFPGRHHKKHVHMHRTTYHRHIKQAIAGLDFSASAHSTRKLFHRAVL